MKIGTNTVLDRLDRRDLLGLVEDVCRRRRVTPDEIAGRQRTRAISAARHEIWWRLRHDPEATFSYAEIGRLFDRDHATVLQGVRAHERRSTRPDMPAA